MRDKQEEAKKEDLNTIRKSIKNSPDGPEVIKTIRNRYESAEAWAQFLEMKNAPYSALAIIHYAAAYNAGPNVVQALKSDLSDEAWLRLLKDRIKASMCTPLHFSAHDGHVRVTRAIRNTLLDPHWYELMIWKGSSETAIHYASRSLNWALLSIFREGLTPEQWYDVISKRISFSGKNALHVAIIAIYHRLPHFIVDDPRLTATIDHLKKLSIFFNTLTLSQRAAMVVSCHSKELSIFNRIDIATHKSTQAKSVHTAFWSAVTTGLTSEEIVEFKSKNRQEYSDDRMASLNENPLTSALFS